MNILLSLTINVIFILFPRLIYLIYLANKQNLKENESTILLDFSLIFSLFLIIVFNKFFFIENIIIYPLLLLLFAFIKKRYFCSIIISIISFEYLYSFYKFNYFLVILLFVGIFIINFIFKNKNKLFIILFYIYSVVFFIILLYLIKSNNYLYLFLNSIIFGLLIKLFIYWINKSKVILELQNILQDYKKNNYLRDSLFKITHEIKNPLAVVKGYLSMIDVNNKEKTIKYLNIIDNEVERTINLLSDFKEFSKIKIVKNEFQFNNLIEEVKNILMPLFDNKNIVCNFKIESLINVDADYNRLKQVLINIIKNSIEASRDFGKIKITVYTNNRSLIVIVKDAGVGMDSECINNLFTPFHTTKTNGTGLGVCLSKEIIEAHKGKIIYDSKLNVGTTVKIVLPIISNNMDS